MNFNKIIIGFFLSVGMFWSAGTSASDFVVDCDNRSHDSTYMYCKQNRGESIVTDFFSVYSDAKTYNESRAFIKCKYEDLMVYKRKYDKRPPLLTLFKQCTGSTSEYLPLPFMLHIVALEEKAFAKREKVLNDVLTEVAGLHNAKIKRALIQLVKSSYKSSRNPDYDRSDFLKDIGADF